MNQIGFHLYRTIYNNEIMKKLILLLFLTPLFTNAEEELKRVLQIYRMSSELDESLAAGDCLYEFEFNASYNRTTPPSVQYSIDGENGEQQLNNRFITIKAKPGKHIFQFYYNELYYEVYSDSLKIKSRHRDRYMVTLQQAMAEPVMSEKPVIYLYPQQSIGVSVKMDIHGENSFLYPAYNDSWEFTAQPNGDLVFGEDTYNYLFWEATNHVILTPKQTSTGFFVKGKSAIPFLEEKLTDAGLNSKEQADFITYWGPRLAQNKLNFVHFEFNETCNKYADLEISPKPDNLYRIYMVWGAVSEEFEVKKQEIEQFDRSGFSVLEWGGQESHIRFRDSRSSAVVK